MGTYRSASVCRRGHTYTTDVTYTPPASRCDICGAELLTACTQCRVAIRGRYHVEGVIGFDSKYEAPDFCFNCGSPFPWASRQARIFELQNLLDDEVLSDADRLTASELLTSLQSPELDEEQQSEKWLRVKKLAPGLLQSGGRIIESIVTAAVKAKLGL